MQNYTSKTPRNSRFISDGYTITAETGYELWLRYHLIADTALRSDYLRHNRTLFCPGTSATVEAVRSELNMGLGGLLGTAPEVTDTVDDGSLIIGTAERSYAGYSIWNWERLHYYSGVDRVDRMRRQWHSIEGKIDPARYRHVADLLDYQYREACW